MSNKVNKLGNNYELNVIDWDKNKLQKYVTLLIVGYFGVKILYGIFNKYSKKPMRDEIIDFSVVIVMGSILYLLTNMDKRHVLGHLNNLNWFFFIGYLIGLNIPFIYQEIFKQDNIANNKAIQYLFYGVFIFIILIMTYLSIRSSADHGNPLYYVLYLIVIAFIIMGLIITRQKPKLYSSTKLNTDGQEALDELGRHFNTDDINKMIDTKEFKQAAEKSYNNRDSNYVDTVANKYLDMASVTDKTNVSDLLMSLHKPIIQKGYVTVHGTYITFGLAAIGWLLSLLFMYDAEETVLQRFLSLFNGFTIGLFVSGASFYGFQYILSDEREKQCFGDECSRENMVLKDKEYVNVASTLSTIKWGLSFTLIILIVTIILFYLLRF